MTATAIERGYMPEAIVKKTTKKYVAPVGKPFELWAVVEHIAQGGPNTWLWLQKTSPSSSAHFFVTKKGEIYQLASIYERTWANGLSYVNGKWIDPEKTVVNPPWHRLKENPGVDPNEVTVSVEHEGYSGEMRTAMSVLADTKILTFIQHETGLVYMAHDTLIGHNEISPINRAFCPGAGYDLELMSRMANQLGGVDPLKVRTIRDGAAKPWYCGTGFFDYYNQFGGLRAFGYPRSHEYHTVAQNGNDVTAMEFERQWIKFDPKDDPWSIRPMLLDEITWFRSKRQV